MLYLLVWPPSDNFKIGPHEILLPYTLVVVTVLIQGVLISP